MAEQDAIIELKGVSKRYGAIDALKGITLSIRNGEFLTFLGPSGCGKTTILRLIAGFERPTTGTIILQGRRVDDLPPDRREVNTVFQSYALFPHMSVRENIAFGLKMKGVPRKEIEERVAEALRMVKLEEFASRRPHQLSGGQQQRVAVARAVVNKPLVLLLDEPLSALDYKLRREMQMELKQLRKALGITFVFVTHDQEEAFSMSDRVVVMNEGAIEQAGTPREIYEEPANLFVARFVGEINILDGHVLSRLERGVEAMVEGRTMLLTTMRELSKGQRIQVLLRPEDMRIVRGPETNGDGFLGTVTDMVYKGTTVDLLVRLDIGTSIAVTQFFNESDGEISCRTGDRVSVSWVPGWEVVLPHG
jgi:spermidine/putrescine transport system ATP-binding protein